MPLNPAWKNAFGAALAFRRTPRKADELTLRWHALEPSERRRAHRLLYAWLRWQGVAAARLRPLLRRPPRVELQVLLELALAEGFEVEPSRAPAIVSHAVDAARALLSPPEARMVNAVLRRALGTDGPPTAAELPASHPAWLVDRWRAQWGEEATRALLAWDQAEAPLYVRGVAGAPPVPGLTPTEWEGFFAVAPEQREAVIAAVDRGEAYIQDPFTRHPVALALAHRPRTVLDLCAAPGGKSRALLDAGTGHLACLVAVDLPGPRLERLEQNLARARTGTAVTVLGADAATLRPADLAARGLPERFEAVLLDVPCSNTGVIQRRPDVRWLLSAAQLDELRATQARLLDAAAALVAPGGVLVHSTCSLEPEENADQVAVFVARHPEFAAGPGIVSRPWLDRHDGGGAFPLTRSEPAG